MDTIAAMRAFAAVARNTSFTGGAKELGLSTKVVSKSVRQLEDRLGVQLFNRTTRKVTLTETGIAYFERCLPMLDQFDELESLVQEKQAVLAGPIRLSAPTAYGSSHLAAALASFQALHPKVEIDLHLADHLISIVDEGFDLAIRFGELADSTLIARQLLQMPVVVYASPEYLRLHGTPQHPSELADHNCLRQKTSADSNHWHFERDAEKFSVRVAGRFRANSPRAIAHMAAGGLGIGRTPLYVAQRFLSEGRLETVLPSFQLQPLSLQAVYPQTRHLVARVRALIDHLAKGLD